MPENKNGALLAHSTEDEWKRVESADESDSFVPALHHKELEMLVETLAEDLNKQYDSIITDADEALDKFFSLNATPMEGNPFEKRNEKARSGLFDAAISAFIAMWVYRTCCSTFRERLFAENCCSALLRTITLMDAHREEVFYAVGREAKRLLLNGTKEAHKTDKVKEVRDGNKDGSTES